MFKVCLIIFEQKQMNLVNQKEQAVLKTIQNFYSKEGKMPTVREIQKEVIKTGIKINSIGSIVNYLNSLEEKGVLKRTSKRRGIELVGKGSKAFANIPILGTANAGTPTFFAQENIEGFLKISKKLIKKNITNNLFAIEVSGNSMDLAAVNNKHIDNGDFVLVDSLNKDFSDNDKVLVTIDGLTTVKTLKTIDENTIGLFPESSDPNHKPIYLTPEDNFVFNGKVIDVLKTAGMGQMGVSFA